MTKTGRIVCERVRFGQGLGVVGLALNGAMMSNDRMLRTTTTMDESELSFDFERTLQPVSPVRRTNSSQEVRPWCCSLIPVKPVLHVLRPIAVEWVDLQRRALLSGDCVQEFWHTQHRPVPAPLVPQEFLLCDRFILCLVRYVSR